jgi:hypothetical protein
LRAVLAVLVLCLGAAFFLLPRDRITVESWKEILLEDDIMTRIVPLTCITLLLGAVPSLADKAFVGKWANVDDKTGGLTRIEITKKDKGWTIQAWAAGGGGEIDQGKVMLSLLGDSAGATEMKYGFASWDHKFKDTHLTLRLEKNRLIVEDFNVFKDNSDRSNYRIRSVFKKTK